MDPTPTPVDAWRAARRFPDTYPGEHPQGSFVVVDELACPLLVDPVHGLRVADGTTTTALDRLLERHGLPLVRGRTPVVAYGGNRNPGTIVLKHQHYAYRNPGSALVVPMLAARLHGADVVAGGLSLQGYIFGDLAVGTPASDHTAIECWAMLLDDEQLRVLHDSEGVRTGAYQVALLDGLVVEGVPSAHRALSYVGRYPTFVSPHHGSPVALADVRADGRTLPAYGNLELLAHVVGSLDLEEELAAFTGIAAGDGFAEQLMIYLNGQFWWQQHTDRPVLRGCTRVMETVVTAIAAHADARSMAARMEEAGRLLDTATAYRPPAELSAASWFDARAG